VRVLAWPAFKNRPSNPYNWMLYREVSSLGVQVEEFLPLRLLRGRYDIWHLHWPESLLNERHLLPALVKIVSLLGLVDVARAKGIKVVWSVHNLRAHEGFHPRMERWFWRAFIRRLDGYIALSEAGNVSALKRFPTLRKVPGFVIPHGHYRGEYPDRVTREEARSRLGLSPTDQVLAFIGNIRPYKGVPRLVRAFRKLTDPEAVLIVAGEPWLAELSQEIEAAAAGDLRIRLFLHFIPDEEVQWYLRAADLVVLPYKDILNSGSALLALSFDLPILVPDKGAMGELQGQVGEEWVLTYTDDLTSKVLREGLERALRVRSEQRAPLDAHDWSKLAGRTIKAYHEISGGRNCKADAAKRSLRAPGGEL
jgi:beta-1,4-mannosyltransferase